MYRYFLSFGRVEKEGNKQEELSFSVQVCYF